MTTTDEPSIEELFDGCTRPPTGCVIVNPFAGNGEIIKWIGNENIIIPYDKEPAYPKVLRRDIFLEKPKYGGTIVIARCPNVKKADSEDKAPFERFGTDNLYKCFVKCLINDPPNSGIIIVPKTFLTGMRESEIKRRKDFFISQVPNRINVFSKTVVIDFRRRFSTDCINETWQFVMYPEKIKYSTSVMYRSVRTLQKDMFDYMLTIKPQKKIYICQTDIPNSSETSTNLVLELKDTAERQMGLYYEEGTNRGLVIRGLLSKKLQLRICEDFNKWLNSYLNMPINQLVPILFMEESAAIEAIKRIIWSYYLA